MGTAFVRRNRALLSALNLCDLIYSPSHSLLARYEQQGIASDKLIHRPYGIPEVSRRTRKIDGSLVFGYVGALAPHKGVETLIDAARLLNNVPWKIRMFGTGAPSYEKMLRKKAKGAPIEFKGEFEPNELPDVLNSIDVLVTPSLWEENSPLVVHEAFSSGIPVVASNIGGLPELVSDAHGGRLFTPGDAPMLANILKALAKDPHRLTSMERKTRTIRSIAKDVAEITVDYSELIKPAYES
jgi:glycosyltransferase involved in cell wall biosynthesis